MFPPSTPFFRGRHDARAAEIAAPAVEQCGGNLSVSPRPLPNTPVTPTVH